MAETVQGDMTVVLLPEEKRLFGRCKLRRKYCISCGAAAHLGPRPPFVEVSRPHTIRHTRTHTQTHTLDRTYLNE